MLTVCREQIEAGNVMDGERNVQLCSSEDIAQEAEISEEISDEFRVSIHGIVLLLEVGRKRDFYCVEFICMFELLVKRLRRI